MSAMGVKIEHFGVPVCNSFRPKVLNDQLCYEVDPNEFKVSENINTVLEKGLSFLVDFNEDREILSNNTIQGNIRIESLLTYNDNDIFGKFAQYKNDGKLIISVNSVGKFLSVFKYVCLFCLMILL